MRLYHPNQIHPSGNIDIIISAPEPEPEITPEITR
jgi:hypothetical protein